jgi:hypothetical protein
LYKLPTNIFNIFEYLFPYEFFNKVNKLNITHCNWFHQNHPQHDIHSLYKYKILKIPIIQNYMIPSQINDLENYVRSICILFSSWWTLFDKKTPHNLGCNIKNFISNVLWLYNKRKNKKRQYFTWMQRVKRCWLFHKNFNWRQHWWRQ